jgi:hypothetical protein
VLFPPLGALVGAQVAGALAAVVATWAVGALAGARFALWFVPGILATLFSGRLTFALGAAAGALAVLAAARGRTALAFLGGAATALCSPVAALFAALCGAALCKGSDPLHGAAPRAGPMNAGFLRAACKGSDPLRWRAGVALAVGAGAVVAGLVVAFPEGGTFPFVASAFWPAFALGIGVALLAPPGPVRVGGALYALLCLAAFLIPSPVGGNATRLGALLALPLAVALLWPHRRLALALLALPLAYWVLQPAVRDVRRAHDDPSFGAAFHQPLLAFLGDRPVRIEIPLTQNHGETRHVAAQVAIARGWERQLDRERNALFYEGRLTPARYERWLHENAIAFVALPLGVPLDASAEDEKRLVEQRPRFLREVARLPTYRVFAVRGARPIGADRLADDAFRTNGTRTVRVRYTPYWAIAEGRGCVGPAPGGWTRVRAAEPVEVRTRFAPGRVRATSARCR